MKKIWLLILKSISFLFLVIFFSTCSFDRSVEALSFSVSSEYEFAGIIPIGESENFYFVKKQFNPNVKIFDKEGTLKDSIPLGEAEKILIYPMTGIWAVSADSIYVYSHYNGTVVLVDNKGIPLFSTNHHDITDENGNYYELLPFNPYHPYTPNKKRVAFLPAGESSGDKGLTTLQSLNNIRKNGYLICRIDFLNTTRKDLNYTFGVCFSDIIEYSVLSDSSYYFMPDNYILTLNGRFFLHSRYSRYIYELSDSLSVVRTLKVIGDDDPLSFPLFLKDGESIQGKADETLLNYTKSACVTTLHYNSITDNYLVILKNGEIKNRKWHNFPFKIQIYDSDFKNKIKEIKIESYDYFPRKSVVISGNLYVEKESKSNDVKQYEIIPL